METIVLANAKKARPKPAAKKPAKSKSSPTSSEAYENVAFVCNYIFTSNRLTGDARLEIDLSERLATNLNLPARFLSANEANAKCSNDQTLFIALNCELPKRLNPVSIRINNDCNNYGENADFYFEPFFEPFGRWISEDAHVYTIKTLPSRVTPQTIADAFRKDPLDFGGKPVIALMLKNPNSDELTYIKRTTDALYRTHQAKLLISTGPRTDPYIEEEIKEAFAGPNCDRIFLWNKSEASENPYLWMLGAATHVVTSGSLSTTSDLLATGKPVYYADPFSLCGVERRMKDKLVSDNAVGQFDDQLLCGEQPPIDVRQSYHGAWTELSRKFCKDLNGLLVARHNRSLYSSAESRVSNG